MRKTSCPWWQQYKSVGYMRALREDHSRRRFLKGAAALGGVALVPPLLGGCEEMGFSDTLAKARDTGVIRVAYAGERPYAYEADDELVGAIPAVHHAVFERLDIGEIKGIKLPWRNLIEGL